MVAAFAGKTRDEWCTLLEATDACFAPVLTLAEAPHHRHALDRGGFIQIDGVTQAAPAPRFSRSQPAVPTPAVRPGTHTDAILADAGFSGAVLRLKAKGVPGGTTPGDLYVRLVVTLPDKPDADLTRFAEGWAASYDPRAKLR